MRNVFLLAGNTLKVSFRKKGSIILYIILPILGVLMSMSIYGGTSSGPVTLGVVNRDNGILSGDMIAFMRQSGNFKIKEIEESKVKETLLSGEAAGILVVPEGFSDGIYRNKLQKAEIVSLKGHESTVWVESFIDLYIRNVFDMAKASSGKSDVFDRIYGNYKKQSLKVTEEKLTDTVQSRFISFQSLGFLILFVMLGTGFTADIILKEKRERTYLRICSAPVNSRVYLLGNIVASIIVVFVQVMLVTIVMTKVLRVNAFIPDSVLVLVLMCFGLVSIGLSMVIVAFSGSSYQASTLSTIVVTPTCMLGGCYWPVDMMPEIMKKISYFMPQRWALDAVQKMQRGGSVEDIIMNFAVLLAFAGVFFSVAVYKFRITDDTTKFV